MPPIGDGESQMNALLELVHGFAQETERNKAMVTNWESSMMEEQDAELEKSVEGLHPSGTSLEEMGSLWASQGISFCERDHVLSILESPLLARWMDGSWKDGWIKWLNGHCPPSQPGNCDWQRWILRQKFLATHIYFQCEPQTWVTDFRQSWLRADRPWEDEGVL